MTSLVRIKNSSRARATSPAVFFGAALSGALNFDIIIQTEHSRPRGEILEDKNEEPIEDLKDFLRDYVKKEQAKPAPVPPMSKEMRGRLVKAGQLGVILLAAVYVWLSLPDLRRAMSPSKPLRQGTYETDRRADECIRALWGLAAGTADQASAVCPVSKLAYKHSGGGHACPNPEKHGFSSLAFVPGRGVVAIRPGEKRRDR